MDDVTPQERIIQLENENQNLKLVIQKLREYIDRNIHKEHNYFQPKASFAKGKLEK